MRHAPSFLGVWVTNCSMPRSPLILPPDWPLHPINSALAAPPLGHCPDTAPRGPRTSWLWPAALGSFHLHSRQSQLVSLTESPMTPLPMGLTTSSLAQSLCVPPASSGSSKDPLVPLTHGPGSAGSMPRRPTLSPTCLSRFIEWSSIAPQVPGEFSHVSAHWSPREMSTRSPQMLQALTCLCVCLPTQTRWEPV